MVIFFLNTDDLMNRICTISNLKITQSNISHLIHLRMIWSNHDKILSI